MKKDVIKINNRVLSRDVEMIGDVEKIRWYEFKIDGFVMYDVPSYSTVEIYDEEDLNELEFTYESMCVLELTPVPPII